MKNQSLHVVLVEDNPDIRDEIQFQLSTCNIHVAALGDAIEFDHYIKKSPCNIAILDIGLPGEDGLSLAGRLHQSNPDMGIIMLTAQGELESRLTSFEKGADIYLVKPVDWRELVAQIKSLQRRLTISEQPDKEHGWLLSRSARELISPENILIPLTHMEGLILKTLAKNQGKTVNRQILIEVIQPKESHVFDPRRLEVCISRLRQKVIDKLNASEVKNNCLIGFPLKTARGEGYIFTEQIEIKVYK